LAAVAVIAAIPVAAFAQEIASPPAGQFLTGPYDPVAGGNFQFVNELVGGSIFYSNGFLGGSTIIGNIEAGHVWGDHEVFNRTGLGIGPAVERQISAPGVTGQIDFHATMVGHVLAGTGYVAASGTSSGGYSYLDDSALNPTVIDGGNSFSHGNGQVTISPVIVPEPSTTALLALAALPALRRRR
jgi:hypothetical protein